tara:strand:+ start:259 stop:837 length:579 start_codon:yes stop_codon:yes gene_type:complete
MKIFFLRHTSLNVTPDMFYGQTDLDVSENFELELKTIKEKIKKQKIDLDKIKFFSSPLKRCLKLAKSISSKINVDDRLKELNLGDWEMKSKRSIPKKMVEKWEADLMSFKIPNGESNIEFLERLENFIKEILELKRDVFIIAHAGSINGLISILIKKPFDKLLKNYWEKIGYGSLSLLEIKDNITKIKFIGK